MENLPRPTKKFHKAVYPTIDPKRPELSAAGKTIVVTGGGSGIGAETARYFAIAGAARIAILGRREQPLLDNKAKIEAESPNTKVLAITADASKADQVEAALAQAAGDGKIDVLVSNAAVIGAMGKIEDIKDEEFISGIVTNLKTHFNLTKTFLKYASKDPILLDTNSAAAHITALPGVSSYMVSKAATARFYHAMAIEHPELPFVSYHPGIVNTAAPKEAAHKEGGNQPDIADSFSNFDDISLPAGFAVYLASPEAKFFRGKYLWANWDVDELKARAKEIESGELLGLGVVGVRIA